MFHAICTFLLIGLIMLCGLLGGMVASCERGLHKFKFLAAAFSRQILRAGTNGP